MRKSTLFFFALILSLTPLSPPTTLAEAPIEVAEVDLTPGRLHLTDDLASIPSFTGQGQTPTLSAGEPLYALAVLSAPPQDLFKKKQVSMVQTLKLGDEVLVRYEYVTPVKKIKGSQVLPVNFIPGKKDKPGEDWSARFALALNALPPGPQTLTLTIESPDASPSLLAQGQITYDGGDAAQNLTRAVDIAHRRRGAVDRAASIDASHSFTLTNTCKKDRKVVIIEPQGGAMSLSIKRGKSAKVSTTPDALVFVNRFPRVDASKIAPGGQLDLCI